MRAMWIRSSCLLLLSTASSASAVSMDWVAIGNPGNACDTQSGGCYGALGYGYNIGKYEVTNGQYAEFLNAKAASDPLGLYNTNMAEVYGGITRSGSSGSYTYTAIASYVNKPVNNVSFFDALRFANWMNNGQGSSDTETGAYTLLGGTATPSNAAIVTRNAGATIVLPSEDEWYKAAYYDALSTSYFDYPMGSNALPTCGLPFAAPNTANCGNEINAPTAVGSYTGSPSPYGTFDQGGNVVEWMDTIIGPPDGRVLRGGSFENDPSLLAASLRGNGGFTGENYVIGFRIAMVPEPGTGLLVIAGLLGLAGWRKAAA